MRQRALTTSVALALLIATAPSAPAVAERVSWDVVAAGGAVESSASGYRMSGTVGQVGVDVLAGPIHRVYSGFWNPWLLSPVGVQGRPDFGVPTTYQLSQNYPNPFGSMTTVPFALPAPGRVSLEIYNLRGQMVRRIAHEAKEAGYYAVTWDGTNDSGRRAGSGVFVCRMIARPSDGNAFVESRRMVLVE